MSARRCLAILIVSSFHPFALAQAPPIPVGVDAYVAWDKLPQQRLGVRSYMRSTYDRSGRNEGADASHYLYQEADDFNVTLDVEGQGILYFARYNHWHGSPWHYEVDGVDQIVRESSTADPNNPVENSVFLPEDLFPHPPTWTWSVTKGADLMWVPIPFEERFRMAYGRTFYGTGYYIYHLYAPGAPVSRPIASWDRTPPDPRIAELLNRAGTPLYEAVPGRTEEHVVPSSLNSGPNAAELFHVAEAGTVRAIEFDVAAEEALDFGRVRLRVTWDDRDAPSIDAPIDLFFGAGILYNRDDREYLVKGLPAHVRYADGRAHLRCYWPMPYFKSARFSLVSEEARTWDAQCRILTEPNTAPPHTQSYFHATYRDFPEPPLGHDLKLLDTQAVEGGGPWSGAFMGTSIIFSHNAVLHALEGDPRFFFDDLQTPSYGTGTEEWNGGGDYWGGRNMTLPLAGHPAGARNAEDAKNAADLVQTAYRFLWADLMPFGHRAVIQLEHGGENNVQEHYETVAYWYGLPAPSLVKTDALDVGKVDDEAAHDYDAEASTAYDLTSRYEWGPDMLYGRELYPAHREDGRRTTKGSEFTVAIDPKNEGVLLRRTLDYGYPDQRAEVFVADGDEWVKAGVWYDAGSNLGYFSPAEGEMGPPNPIIQTSNRRFRDSEFLIPLALTKGKSLLRIRTVYTPIRRPVIPGWTVPDLAWTELRYEVWSWVLPDFTP